MGNSPNPALASLMESKPDQPTVVQRIKSSIAQRVMPLASKKWGALVQYAAGATTSWLANVALANFVGTLGNLGVVLTDEQTATFYNAINSVQELMVVTGALAFGAAVQYVQTKWNIKLQTAIGTDADGWVGPETVRKAIEIKQETP